MRKHTDTQTYRDDMFLIENHWKYGGPVVWKGRNKKKSVGVKYGT